MPPDDIRVTFSLSALWGGVVWGLYRLGTMALAGQRPSTQDLILAGLNVAAAMAMGVIAAYFVGPALATLIPLESLRDPHAVGFGIGAGAWESAGPLVDAWRKFVVRKTDGGAA